MDGHRRKKSTADSETTTVSYQRHLSRRRPSFKTHPLYRKQYSTNGRTTIPVVLKKLPKEKAITNFVIQLDNSNGESILAGTNLNGKVSFDIRRQITVWYVELIVEGIGATYCHRGAYGTTELDREFYLKKQTFVMGSGRTNRVVHLHPGTYNTEFSYNLPETIPPTLTYANPRARFAINIQYQVKVRICDDMNMVRLDSTGTRTKHLVKVVKKMQLPFRVHRNFNLAHHPLAYTCLSHTETFNTSCLSRETMAAQISMKTDRSVYQLGDQIELHLEATTDSKHFEENHVKGIKLELIQNASLRHFEKKSKRIREKKLTTIVAAFQRKIRLGGDINDLNTTSDCEIFFTIPKTLIPSIIPGCHLVDIRYTLRVILQFSKFGGTLLSEFPLIIGPAGVGTTGDGRESIPVFDQQALMEFPKFRVPSTNLLWRNSIASANSITKGATVNTKYYNWLDSVFLLSGDVK